MPALSGAEVSDLNWRTWKVRHVCRDEAADLTWRAWGSQLVSASVEVAAATAASEVAWRVWNASYAEEVGRRHAARQRVSEEEARRHLLQEQEYRRREEESARKAVEAKDRAEALLRLHLSPEQRDDLDRSGCFYVTVRGDRYRISRGRSGNVKLLDAGGQVKRSFCLHPGLAVPDADTMLAQKLLLESCVEDFYRIANVTEYEGGRSSYFSSPRGLELLRAAGLGEGPPANDQRRAA